MTLIENGFQASNFTLKLYREMYVQFPLMLVLTRTTESYHYRFSLIISNFLPGPNVLKYLNFLRPIQRND